MVIPKAQRIELNEMSQRLFGSSSRWQKLVEKGYDELVTEEKEETVPAAKEGDEPTVRTVKVPVLSASGSKQYVRKYHTVESVREFMVTEQARVYEFIKQRSEILAKLAKEESERREAKKLEDAAKGVHQAASGGARV